MYITLINLCLTIVRKLSVIIISGIKLTSVYTCNNITNEHENNETICFPAYSYKSVIINRTYLKKTACIIWYQFMCEKIKTVKKGT